MRVEDQGGSSRGSSTHHTEPPKDDFERARPKMHQLISGIAAGSAPPPAPMGNNNVSSFQPAHPGAQSWNQFNATPMEAPAVTPQVPQGGGNPPGIDTSKLGWTDKAVIDALGVGNMQPGSTTTVEVKANAQLADMLGVNVGATVTVSVTRDADNPNQFKFSFGVEGTVEGEASVNSSGAGAEVAAGVDGGVSVEFTVDLSQPGEATQLAGFAAHLGLMAVMPPGAANALSTLESIPGIDLPGEPVPFLKEHISAIELSGNFHLSEELGLVLGEGGKASAEQYLQGGGRIDFNPDGTLTLTGKIGAGYEFEVSAGVGVDNTVNGSSVVAAQTGELNFVGSVTVNPTLPPTVISQSLGVEIKLGGQLLHNGLEGTLTVDLNQALASAPPEIRARFEQAVSRGDMAEAARIFTEELLPTTSIPASLEIVGSDEVNGEVEVGLEELGVGGAISVGGSVTTETTIFSDEVTLTPEGISFGDDTGGEVVPWAELEQQIQQQQIS